MADSLMLSAATTSRGDVYAQRRLIDAPTAVALFHASSGPRHEPANLMSRRRPLPVTSCLRKISAYNGGFRVSDDEDEASVCDGVAVARYAKKRLSFADQHGGQLVLEREFHAREAPIYCNKAITSSLPSLYVDGDDRSSWRSGSPSIMERLLRGIVRSGGRGDEEQKSGWSQPELVSFCVLSCSVVGYVALNYARTVQSK